MPLLFDRCHAGEATKIAYRLIAAADPYHRRVFASGLGARGEVSRSFTLGRRVTNQLQHIGGWCGSGIILPNMLGQLVAVPGTRFRKRLSI